MAKKVVATLKKADGKGFTRVIKCVKSAETGGYQFKELIVPAEQAKAIINKK